MANINLFNNGVAQGNLAADPHIYPNKDGSRTVLFTVMAKNNYKTDGEIKSTGIDLKAFIPATQADDGIYGILKEGMPVLVAYTVQQDRWTDETGQKHYKQNLRVVDVRLTESKAASDARAARRKAAEAKASADAVAETEVTETAVAETAVDKVVDDDVASADELFF